MTCRSACTRWPSQRAGAESLFDPAALPAVPTGLDDSSETVMVETLDDGRRVVSITIWVER